MKKLCYVILLIVASPSFADVDCKPIYDSDPVSVEVSAKKGKESLIANLVVSGNALSSKQPAERLEFLVGTLSFSLVPIFSCQDGLSIEFVDSRFKKKSLVKWGVESMVDGIANTEYFVKVLVQKKPKLE